MLQGVIPDAGELFNDAAQTLSDIPVEEGSSMTVTTDESTGRTNFNYEDDEVVVLRTDDGLFTPEFYEDENITVKLLKPLLLLNSKPSRLWLNVKLQQLFTTRHSLCWMVSRR